MANEINLSAVLTIQRYSPPLQGTGSKNINQQGTRGIANVMNVTTSANVMLKIDDTTNLGYVFVKNLDTTAASEDNYVHVALDNGSPPANVIARLKAQEFCLVPVKANTTALYARAFGIATDVLFVAAQP